MGFQVLSYDHFQFQNLKKSKLHLIKNNYKYERRKASKSFEVFFWHKLILTGKGWWQQISTQHYNQFVAKKNLLNAMREHCKLLKKITWEMMGQIEINEMFILGFRRPSQISLSVYPPPYLYAYSTSYFYSSHIHYICNSEMYPNRTSTPVLRSYEFKEVNFMLDLKVWSLPLKFDFSVMQINIYHK